MDKRFELKEMQVLPGAFEAIMDRLIGGTAGRADQTLDRTAQVPQLTP